MSDFELTDRRVVWLPVPWKMTVPGEGDAATVVEKSIDMLVELLDRDAFVEWAAQPDPEDEPEKFAAWTKRTEVERVRGVASNWRKVKMGGKDAPFDDEHITKMLQIPGFANGFNLAYQRAMNAVEATRSGN